MYNFLLLDILRDYLVYDITTYSVFNSFICSQFALLFFISCSVPIFTDRLFAPRTIVFIAYANIPRCLPIFVPYFPNNKHL